MPTSSVAAAWYWAARRPASLGTAILTQTLRVATTSASSPAPCRKTLAPAGRSARSVSPEAS
eukprot:3779179-Lingulodinium_polyedra.AAC.1